VRWKVVVIRRKMKKNLGLASFDGEKFEIAISSNESKQEQVDIIMHEWAHILCMEQAYTHGGQWGDFYGKLHESYETKLSTKIKQ
jgi:Zn-dependent peptidase ImmA (M78 family)